MDGFVEVTVDATGETQMVPEHWIGDPVCGRGLTVVDHGDADPAPVAAPEPPSDVQLVLGEERTESWSPAERDARRAAAEAPASEGDGGDEPPTEKSLVADIDAYAQDHHIDLAGASTKAEKLAVIAEHTTDTDDTESPDETPDNGDEEN